MLEQHCKSYSNKILFYVTIFLKYFSLTFLLANNCQRYMVLGKLNIKGKLLNCDCKFLYNQSLGKFLKNYVLAIHTTHAVDNLILFAVCICLFWCYFQDTYRHALVGLDYSKSPLTLLCGKLKNLATCH